MYSQACANYARLTSQIASKYNDNIEVMYKYFAKYLTEKDMQNVDKNKLNTKTFDRIYK